MPEAQDLALSFSPEKERTLYFIAAVGEDPDKRDYIVSNARIAGTGFKPEWGLDRGIRELIKVFTILRNSQYSNV